MQVARQMQQLLGGGRKGSAGSRDPKEEKPKARIVVDERNRALVLTGPKFIHEKVLEVVQAVDKERNSNSVFKTYNMTGQGNAEEIARTLKGIFGEKVVILNDEEGAGGNGNTGRTSAGNSRSTPAPVGIPSNFARMLQQRAGERGNTGPK